MPAQTRRREEADRQWLRTVRERYLSLVAWRAGQLLSDRMLVEDVIAQVFEELYRRPDRVETGGQAFVLLLTECRCLDLLRRLKRVPVPTEDSELERAAPRQTEGCGLRECIEALSEDDRRLVLLHWHYGYTAAEIARLEGILPETARKRLQRARRRLEILCREEHVL